MGSAASRRRYLYVGCLGCRWWEVCKRARWPSTIWRQRLRRMDMLKNSWVFYVQPTNKDGNTNCISDAIRVSWDPIWTEENKLFENECDQHAQFSCLKDKMFSMFDGNHRLFAWRVVCEACSMEARYHPRVHAKIFTRIKDSYIKLKSTMHAINQWVPIVISVGRHLGFLVLCSAKCHQFLLANFANKKEWKPMVAFALGFCTLGFPWLDILRMFMV